MVHAVSRWPLNPRARFQTQASTYDVCGGQSDIRTGLSSSTSVFLGSIILKCPTHSHILSFIYLSATLYNVKSWKHR